jgi:hypothetical protein
MIEDCPGGMVKQVCVGIVAIVTLGVVYGSTQIPIKFQWLPQRMC